MNYLLPNPILDLAHTTDSRRTLHAVTLFLDISGFTPLTEALMTQGKVGAEILANIVNDTFRPVISAIYAHGGYISGFAGDAFTAVFEKNRNLEAEKNVLNAAIVIRSLFENKIVNTPTGTFPLAVKLGLASGEIEYGLVGDESHRAYYYRGTAIDACVQAEHHCDKGDIVLTADLQAELNADCVAVNEHFFRLQTWRNAPSPSAIFPEFEIESAAAFYPRSIIESAVAGEFRQLATVFVSFRNFSTDADLNTFMSDVLREVNSREGYFNRLDFGDKGGNCLIFFGAPAAHENDVARALQLALFLREKYGTNVRVGVTVGQTYFGRVGIPERCEFTALGTAVNFAARLMMKADWGQILAPERVTQQTGFVFTSLGAFAYKGFAAPVDTFQLERLKLVEDNFFTAPMAGRTDELRALIDVASAAFARQAQAALIYGEPGMGKSRLAYALRESLGERVVWVEGQTDSILRQAFNPFIYILQNYFEQTPDSDHARFEMRFQSLQAAVKSEELRAELIRTQSFLGALINLHWTDSLYAQLDDPKLRYGNTLAALRAFLLALAQTQPLVIQIEDGHWLDSASREMLTRLTRQTVTYPILLLITSRYNDDGSLPEFQIEEWGVTHLELRQLPSESLHVLVEQQMSGSLHDSLFAFLEARSQGVPFFAQQLALYLQETNAVTLSNGLWSLRGETNAIPDSLQAMLIARLDRLSQQVKDTVQTAAVLGREFDVRLLSQMLHMESAPIVGEAERGQIWSALTEWRYLFKHLLLREAAYEMQLRARLRDLHHAALTAYENFYAANLHPHYADLAYHAEHSGDEAKQREYFHLAGDVAYQNSDLQSAARYYVGALRLIPTDHEIYLSLATRLAETRLHLGELATAREGLQAALAVFGGAAVERVIASQVFGKILYESGDHPGAHQALTEALPIARACRDDRVLGRFLVTLGIVDDDLGYPEGEAFLREGRELAHRAGDVVNEIHALRRLGVILVAKGEGDQGRQYWQDAADLATTVENRTESVLTLFELGARACDLKNYTDSKDYYQQAMTLAHEIGAQPRIAEALLNLGCLEIDLHNNNGAREYFQQALTLYSLVGSKTGVAVCLNNLGSVAPDPITARDYTQQALAAVLDSGVPDRIGYYTLNLAINDVVLGDLPAARAGARTVLAQSRDLGTAVRMLQAVNVFALIAHAEGQTQRALALFGLGRRQTAWVANRQIELDEALERWSLEPSMVEAGLAEGEKLDWETTVQELLQE